MSKPKSIKTGFFTVDDLHAITTCATAAQAKSAATAIVDEFVRAHPKVRTANVKKVTETIAKSSTVDRLAIAMANFMLAHPSENLSMSRGEA
jgi:hypothetical protein